jgi:hypothetical protein
LAPLRWPDQNFPVAIKKHSMIGIDVELEFQWGIKPEAKKN